MISVSLFYETVLITIVTIVLHSIYSGMPLFLRHHHSYIPPRSFCTSISKYCVFHIHYLYWVACLYFYNTILTIAAIFTTPFSPSPTFLQHHSHHRRHFYNNILTIADIFTTPFSPSPTFLQHHSHHRRHFPSFSCCSSVFVYWNSNKFLSFIVYYVFVTSPICRRWQERQLRWPSRWWC